MLLEFSEKVINQLIQKFSNQTSLSAQGIRKYIERFDQIKSSPNVEKKDPFQYTWKDFEQTVDANQPKRIKAGKLDATVEDANLVYNKNGIRVYLGADKESCVKYGNGYGFCISARGEDNLYADYRLAPVDYGTYKKIAPYFVFNDNLSSEMENEEFVDPKHLLVIFVTDAYRGSGGGTSYTVTEADNEEEVLYASRDFVMDHPVKSPKPDREMFSKYPWLKGVKNYLVPVAPSKKEMEEYKIRQEFKEYKERLGNTLRISDLSTGNAGTYLYRLEELMESPDGPNFYQDFINSKAKSVRVDYEMDVPKERAYHGMKHYQVYIYANDSQRKRAQKEIKEHTEHLKSVVLKRKKDPSTTIEDIDILIKMTDDSVNLYRIIEDEKFSIYLESLNELIKTTNSRLNKLKLDIEESKFKIKNRYSLVKLLL